MELISNSRKLESEFLRLLDTYQEYYWLTAWAGVSSKAFSKLVNHQKRIKKIVVGLHFYQTHPDFIEKFMDLDTVRYIKQPEGTFHPKMFLFYNSKDNWEVLIGSANFTNSAFNLNTEISTLITSNDSNFKIGSGEIFDIINSIWKDAQPFGQVELDDYRKIWDNNRSKLNSLSGSYGTREANFKSVNKPIFQIPIMKMDWQQFIQKVSSEKNHLFDSRLKVLNISREFFNRVNSFRELETDERKFIAGINNNSIRKYGVDCKLFGSMVGNGIFKNRIIENDERVSEALNEIPLSGQITRSHYDRYIDLFNSVFDGNYIGTSTRLLAMKRPDVFVCIDEKNRTSLCEAFGIKKTSINYKRYWEEIILRIYDSEWWLNPHPQNNIENEVSNSRAAFLDALYYLQ